MASRSWASAETVVSASKRHGQLAEAALSHMWGGEVPESAPRDGVWQGFAPCIDQSTPTGLKPYPTDELSPLVERRIVPKPMNQAKANSRANRGTVGARVPLLELPASGCNLPVPPLPRGRDWSTAERARWRELWRSPQANQWDESCRGTVAALVTFEAAILDGSASAWQAQECRYAAEALGLTPRALGQLGWRIVADDDQ